MISAFEFPHFFKLMTSHREHLTAINKNILQACFIYSNFYIFMSLLILKKKKKIRETCTLLAQFLASLSPVLEQKKTFTHAGIQIF